MEIIFAFVIIALFLAAFQLTLEWASDNFFIIHVVHLIRLKI